MANDAKERTSAAVSAGKRKPKLPNVIDGATGSVIPVPQRITGLKSAKAVRLEISRVYRSARKGEIPPEVATKLAYILHTLMSAVEIADLEARLEALERQRAATGWPR